MFNVGVVSRWSLPGRARLRRWRGSVLAALCFPLWSLPFCGDMELSAQDLRLPTGGINLGPHSFFERSFPFVDYSKMGQDWTSTDGFVWVDDRPLELGENGYPVSLLENQFARTLMFTHNGEFYPTGTYQVAWDGTGEVALRGPNHSATLIESAHGMASYDVTSTNPQGLLLEIRATDPSDPVRNIRVFEESLAAHESPFHPEYTADLEPYGVLRFMDWNQTNDSHVAQWSDRTELDDALWGGANGIPIERQIDLSNQMQQDIWINVPHAAGNRYIRELGRLLDERLDPNLRVWIEYTNEYWNPLFSQNTYVQSELTARYGVSGQTHAYALRSAEMFDVFAEEFESERTVRVFGAWASVLFPMWAGLPLITDEAGNTNADVTAIAAYFDLPPDKMQALYRDYAAGEPIDMDQVFADLRADIDHNAVTWRENYLISSEYGLPMVAYEAGQHITPKTAAQRNDEGFLQLLYDINRDERMAETYEYLIDTWREIGGSTMTFYNNVGTWSRNGMWGLREGFYDDEAPKQDAVHDYLDSNPAGFDLENRVWIGDVNGDNIVDVADLHRLTRAIRVGGGSAIEDVNRDGRVNLEDREFFISEILGTVIGDSNLDGVLSTADLVHVFEAGVYEDDVLFNGTWSNGDWNGDLEFDTSDFVYLLERGTFVDAATAATVPEPAAPLKLVAAILMIVTARCRSRLRSSPTR